MLVEEKKEVHGRRISKDLEEQRIRFVGKGMRMRDCCRYPPLMVLQKVEEMGVMVVEVVVKKMEIFWGFKRVL